MVDLIALPATACGLGETVAQSTLGFLYSDVKYTEDGNRYTIEYKANEEGKIGKFVAEYDLSTDSAHMEYLENEEWVCTIEYVKLKKGYGSLYIAKREDRRNKEETDLMYTAYKSIYADDNLVMGFLENVEIRPDSIYKKAKSCTEEWVKEGNNWMEYKNGVGKAVFNEKETNF